MNESRTVTRLRRNDPIIKFVYIRLRDEEDIALAEALEQNDYVNEILLAMPEQPHAASALG